MEPEGAVEWEDLVGRDGHVAGPAYVVVAPVGVRDDGVEAVVAAVQHDVHDDALVSPDRRRRERLRQVEAEPAEPELIAECIEGRTAQHSAADGLEELAPRPTVRFLDVAEVTR